MAHLQKIVSKVKQGQSAVCFKQTSKLHPVGWRQLIVRNKQFFQCLVEFDGSNYSLTDDHIITLEFITIEKTIALVK